MLSHFLCYTPVYICRTREPKANLAYSHFSEIIKPVRVESAFHRETRIRSESLSSAPKKKKKKHLQKKKKKKYCTPIFVIYSESKRKRHMKQWTELSKLGLSPDKTGFLVDFRSYARRKRRIKCQVCPTTLSIYNQHVWTESTVQLPPVWASQWHWQSVCERTVVCMNWSKMSYVFVCARYRVYA